MTTTTDTRRAWAAEARRILTSGDAHPHSRRLIAWAALKAARGQTIRQLPLAELARAQRTEARS